MIRSASMAVVLLLLAGPAAGAERAPGGSAVVAFADSTEAVPRSDTVAPLVIPDRELLTDPRATARPQLPREPRRDPFTHAGRSLILPGWGQAALGDVNGALAHGGAFALSLAFATGLAQVPLIDDEDFSKSLGIGMWVTTAVFAAVDAYRGADRMNRENGYELDDALFDDVRSGSPGVRLVLVRRDF